MTASINDVKRACFICMDVKSLYFTLRLFSHFQCHSAPCQRYSALLISRIIQVFLWYLGFFLVSIILPMHYTYLHPNTVIRRTKWQNRETLDTEYFSFSSYCPKYEHKHLKGFRTLGTNAFSAWWSLCAATDERLVKTVIVVMTRVAMVESWNLNSILLLWFSSKTSFVHVSGCSGCCWGPIVRCLAPTQYSRVRLGVSWTSIRARCMLVHWKVSYALCEPSQYQLNGPISLTGNDGDAEAERPEHVATTAV